MNQNKTAPDCKPVECVKEYAINNKHAIDNVKLYCVFNLNAFIEIQEHLYTTMVNNGKYNKNDMNPPRLKASISVLCPKLYSKALSFKSAPKMNPSLFIKAKKFVI